MSEATSFDAEAFLRTVTTRPGVYKMVSGKGEVLYIGKAGNLKKRLASYFRPGASAKQKQIVSRLGHIEVAVTTSEAEALLLESQWIKRFQPRYNVALKDDKRYPYLQITLSDPFPRLTLYRGEPREGDRCFGPYPSVGAVRSILDLLAPIFQLRSCPDSTFRNRCRPCLEHQLGRCSAPCVGQVDQKAYRQQVERLIAFFEGKGEALMAQWISEMKAAAQRLEFEKAAGIRDRITALREVLALKGSSRETTPTDIVVHLPTGEGFYFYVARFRQGIYVGGRGFLWPALGGEEEEVLESFLTQYYLVRPNPAGRPDLRGEAEEKPQRLLVMPPPKRPELIAEVVGLMPILKPKGALADWLNLTRANAEEALRQFLVGSELYFERWRALCHELGLPSLERLEGFDISHLQGRGTVASCVVFDPFGPRKEEFRTFNIEGETAGDDYGALRQVVYRRFRRLFEEGQSLPDLLVIDGGRGQVEVVESVLQGFGLDGIPILGIVKGGHRRLEEDRFYLGWKKTFWWPKKRGAALLLQQIRNEAHRTALKAQQRRRRFKSPLEEIPGIGPKRRKLLLKQFGGLQGLKRASREALAQVEGIGPKLAEQIYAALHEME